ncbi:hypothetical protein H7F33_07145 [Pedobacter sp. PAMC26386]|nr:hypothetical protein H7F33_07145 [Pedobacter sp. PAMC26386]
MAYYRSNTYRKARPGRKSSNLVAYYRQLSALHRKFGDLQKANYYASKVNSPDYLNNPITPFRRGGNGYYKKNFSSRSRYKS